MRVSFSASARLKAGKAAAKARRGVVTRACRQIDLNGPQHPPTSRSTAWHRVPTHYGQTHLSRAWPRSGRGTICSAFTPGTRLNADRERCRSKSHNTRDYCARDTFFLVHQKRKKQMHFYIGMLYTYANERNTALVMCTYNIYIYVLKMINYVNPRWLHCTYFRPVNPRALVF